MALGTLEAERDQRGLRVPPTLEWVRTP
jgi:hypothetical protein